MNSLVFSSVKILLAEDVSTDAELVKREIKKVLPNSIFEVVYTREAFIEALERFVPDLILSDYRMPIFDGMSALKIAMDKMPDTPVIIVTGSINEETAVKCMKAGAIDYILKESLKRLGQAVLNALEQKEIKLKKREAEEALRQSEKDYRRLINGMNESVWIINPDNGRLLDVNKSAIEKLGYTREKLLEIGLTGIDKYLSPETIENMMNTINVNKFQVFETEHTPSKGSPIPVEISSSLIKYRGKEVILSVARDISDRLKVEEELRLVNRAIEQSPISIVITDKNGVIEYVNSSFTSITGYLPDEVKGKKTNILKSGKQPESIYKDLWNTILAGKEWFGELLNKKKNGDLYWADVSISPVINLKGELTHFVSVREDITEKKKMLEDLMAAKEKAEESDRLKSAFLANMSHEIRTPMNGILGFASLLKEPHLSESERENFVNIIEKSGERMLATLNDLIDISKIESGVVEIEYSELHVHLELQLLFNFFNPEAAKKGLLLFYNFQKEKVDFTMKTDRLKVLAVMSNLIKNALKYTLKGNVEFGWKLENDQILFFVKDTGIGIDEKKKDAVFERFIQADISISRNFEGSGLGLSISKAYVEMLGGRIWFESVLGKGSEFYFLLPVSGNNKLKQDLETRPESLENGVLNRITVLVAEDDEIGKLYLSSLLGNKCKKIYYATNGMETVELFEENNDIDLILMDIRMPVMDGYKAIQKIRSKNKQIVIFAQTAYAMTGDREKALEAGCNEYLIKPINQQLLLETVDKYFGKKN